MKRKTFAIALLMVMALLCGAAQAEQATLSPSLYDVSALEKFASYAEENGVYTVRSYAADAALHQLATSGSGGACYFTLELTGVKALGIVQPVLTLYYRGSQALNARAVTLVLGEERYVLAASSTQTTLERRRVEVISAPLTKEAYALIPALAAASEARLRVCGDRVYTATLKAGATTLEAQSLTGSQAMVDALSALPMESYALWDLSAGWWEAQHGFAPRMDADTLSADESGLRYDALGMLAYGDSGAAVKNAQEKLIAQGFLYGTAKQSFTEEMQTAVTSAQKYYGLIETGCVDARLMARLNGAAAEAEPADQALAMTAIGDTRVGLYRAWLAQGVAPSAPQQSDIVTPLNSDNLLLVADGLLANLSASELRLYRDMTAAFVCGEYRFEATLVCEVDEGKAFSTDVLPLANARLVAYAEIPVDAAKLTGWQLEIACGEQSGTWTVE